MQLLGSEHSSHARQRQAPARQLIIQTITQLFRSLYLRHEGKTAERQPTLPEVMGFFWSRAPQRPHQSAVTKRQIEGGEKTRRRRANLLYKDRVRRRPSAQVQGGEVLLTAPREARESTAQGRQCQYTAGQMGSSRLSPTGQAPRTEGMVKLPTSRSRSEPGRSQACRRAPAYHTSTLGQCTRAGRGERGTNPEPPEGRDTSATAPASQGDQVAT